MTNMTNVFIKNHCKMLSLPSLLSLKGNILYKRILLSSVIIVIYDRCDSNDSKFICIAMPLKLKNWGYYYIWDKKSLVFSVVGVVG